nr:DUF334 domain-containing protein [Staphylococcus saprophyticus]
MKDIKNNKENPNTQTESKSIGMYSNNTQNNLSSEELNELKRQNKLIVNYLAEMQENQKTREKEQEAITSKLKEMAEVFRSSGIQAHNDFVVIAQEKLGKVNTEDIQAALRQDVNKVREENEEMLRKVRDSHEHYQKRQKQLFTGIGAMLLVFMTFVWYLAYGLPYIVSIGLFIGLYEWIRARFQD